MSVTSNSLNFEWWYIEDNILLVYEIMSWTRYLNVVAGYFKDDLDWYSLASINACLSRALSLHSCCKQVSQFLKTRLFSFLIIYPGMRQISYIFGSISRFGYLFFWKVKWCQSWFRMFLLKWKYIFITHQTVFIKIFTVCYRRMLGHQIVQK